MAGIRVAITPDEFLKMAEATDDRLELVDGEVLRMSPAGARHGSASGNVCYLLGQLLPAEHFRVFNHVGWLLPSGNVRGPDVCVVSAEVVRAKGIPAGWWTGPIELAVEVIGAEDRAAELDRKTEEYFAAGARHVWRVNPETQKLAIYRSPKDVRIFSLEDEVDGTDFHPALHFPVRRIFE
jgi:Uma2 family endonuclease